LKAGTREILHAAYAMIVCDYSKNCGLLLISKTVSTSFGKTVRVFKEFFRSSLRMCEQTSARTLMASSHGIRTIIPLVVSPREFLLITQSSSSSSSPTKRLSWRLVRKLQGHVTK